MYRTFLALTLFCAALRGGEADPQKAPTQSSYSNAELISARQRWVGQENRIGQLKFEAREYARTQPVQYMCGANHVANIDHTTQTVTTFIPQQPSVVLSYVEFDALLRDPVLTKAAYEAYSKIAKR